MKQFRTILDFEFRSYLKNKVFVGVTVAGILIIAVILSFPRLRSMTGSSAGKSRDGAEGGASLPVMSVFSDTGDFDAEETAAALSQALAGTYDVRAGREAGAGQSVSEAEIRKMIESGDIKSAVVMHSLTSYTYYVGEAGMYDSTPEIIDGVVSRLATVKTLEQYGISARDAESAISPEIGHEVRTLGKDQRRNFFYTYIMIFALYMVILMYGQMVSTSVASEKSSRAMELLITSADPVAMMFGKVIASCLAGLLQLVCLFGAAFAFYNLNRSYWSGGDIVSSVFDIPLGLLAYMLLFFMLGFFIYAFLYGAIGSTATRLEDINTSTMPITLLMVLGMFAVIFSLTSGNPDSTLMKVLSFVPFTSPMAMFSRIAMSEVPAWQIALSIGLLAAGVVGVGYLAAKIYRVGVLLYGTQPKPGAIIKAVREA